MKKTIKAPLFTNKGKENGSVDLPEAVFGVKWNSDLVHSVVTAMRSNARSNTAHAKDRSDVSGGGKKPWRQKGTGKARHGSTRSPIWVGGGVAHGPTNERNYDRKINQKARQRALFSVLSKKLTDGEVIFVEDLSFENAKTKNAQDFITTFAAGDETREKVFAKSKNSAVFALPEKNEEVKRSFSNMSHTSVVLTENMNPIDLLNATYVVFVNPEVSLEILNKREKNSKKKEVEAVK